MVDERLERFKASHILVVGDVMLDEYIKGVVDRISPEAPVPILRVRSEAYVPGGAANVANNIVSLGGSVDLVGLVGDDVAGDRLRGLLAKRGISSSGLIKDAGYVTTQKTRLIAHTQHVARVDREGGSHESFDALCEAMDKRIADADAIIISDYRKGVITDELVDHIRSIAGRRREVPIIVDPKPPHGDMYRGVWLITPNLREAEKLSGIDYDGENIDEIGGKISRELSTSVIITRGEQGMSLYGTGGRCMDDGRLVGVHFPAAAKEVFDVSGAGDTVIAALGLCIGARLPLAESAQIANYAAGIVVEKIGTAIVTPEELERRMKDG